jgi:glycosyltransferase involved in cell wall biosynthesis
VQHGVARGGTGTGILSRIKHHVPKAAVRSSAHIFTVSEFVRSAYVEHGMAAPDTSSSVFNIMPDVEPAESDVAEARRLVEDLNGPVILFAGRLTIGKGLGMLIDAMPGVLRQIPEATLLVVGGGDAAVFQSQAAANMVSYGVRFTGHLSNGVTRALLNRASAVAMPSLHHEPLARVLLEAIAVGVPVVATPYGGTPEVIEDRKNGLIIDPVGPEALAGSLLRAITDEGLRTSSQQFDAELKADRLNPMRTIEATVGVYETALAA